MAKIEKRLDRLEAIAILLLKEASRGKGQSGKPYWDFIDALEPDHRNTTPTR